jgi:hypothetical protein
VRLTKATAVPRIRVESDDENKGRLAAIVQRTVLIRDPRPAP